jgi:hypothetical protein
VSNIKISDLHPTGFDNPPLVSLTENDMSSVHGGEPYPWHNQSYRLECYRIGIAGGGIATVCRRIDISGSIPA